MALPLYSLPKLQQEPTSRKNQATADTTGKVGSPESLLCGIRKALNSSSSNGFPTRQTYETLSSCDPQLIAHQYAIFSPVKWSKQ